MTKATTLEEFDKGVTLNPDGSAYVRSLDLKELRAALVEAAEDRQELIAVRLALSKGLGVEKGHCVGLIESLHGRLEEAQTELKKLNEEMPHLKTLHVEGGQLDMTIEGAKTTTLMIASALATTFEAEGGTNYVQFEVRKGEKDYILVLQKASGKTPHQLRKEADDKVTRLREALSRHAQLARTLSEYSPGPYKEEHLMNRLAEADKALEETKP